MSVQGVGMLVKKMNHMDMMGEKGCPCSNETGLSQQLYKDLLRCNVFLRSTNTHVFIHSFMKYLLSAYGVSDPVPDPGVIW